MFLKFLMEYDIKLKGILFIMGMFLVFFDLVDFLQMIEGGGVKIDDVIYKVFIEVNEEGIEVVVVMVVVVVEILVFFFL